MLNISLFEKIKTVFNLILTAPYFLLLLVFAIIVYFLLFQSTKQKKEEKLYIYVGLYGLILLALVIKYNKEIFAFLDYLVDNLFVVFYFPNLAAYILMILVINVILLVTIFSRRISNTIKKINIATYCLMTYILFLTLDLIAKKNLNFYVSTDIYSNKEIMSLIQINNIVFIIWLMAIVIYKISGRLVEGPERFERVEARKTSTTKKRERVFIPSSKTRLPENFIAREAKPRVIYQTRIEKEPDLFTKDEYIAVLKILKNIQNNR